jgi:hypothetical protein
VKTAFVHVIEAFLFVDALVVADLAEHSAKESNVPYSSAKPEP